ncbi:serine carboxypeptidase-like 12 [Lycium ferocissimum]|uniref:serine carboxypeptidase-like 12 n=1 Tax=Lycium ferocissimum TaxID=112874 RepID=UPI0028163513|nr:serine carboxypeptidase-like 12 [Lycium ferocissimum]
MLSLIVFYVINIAIAGSPVKFLPGFEGPLPFELETGYIGVREGDEVQLFYYFIKSQSNPKVDPLILWVAGGPGCSALYAVVTEIGPVLFVDKEYDGRLPTLSSNPYAYTKVASIIFLDLPVGTGFSYATTSKANHSNNIQAADHAYQFLRKWLVEHPEYGYNSFYVGGDSYSGITVPIVTNVISYGIDMGIKPIINLKGYILGNPVTIIPHENNYRVAFTHGMGLISDELYESLVANCGGEYEYIDPTNAACLRDVHTFQKLCKGIYEYHILEPLCDPVILEVHQSHYSRRSMHEMVKKLKNPATLPGVKCRDDWYELSVIWANDDKVREALHVRKGTTGAWEQCRSNYPFTLTINNTLPYHAYLSTKGYRSLIYSGDHDLDVPFIATRAWISSLNYSIVDDWRPWLVDGQIAGYTRAYANQITYATLKGAGHTAPEWTPVECFAMLKRWISYVPL